MVLYTVKKDLPHQPNLETSDRLAQRCISLNSLDLVELTILTITAEFLERSPCAWASSHSSRLGSREPRQRQAGC